MLGESLLAPEYLPDEISKALNIQYPNSIDGDAIVVLEPNDAEQTLVKWSGYWLIFQSGKTNKMFTPKRVIADLTGGFSEKIVTTATSVDAGKLALFGLIGFLLFRGAVR